LWIDFPNAFFFLLIFWAVTYGQILDARVHPDYDDQTVKVWHVRLIPCRYSDRG